MHLTQKAISERMPDIGVVIEMLDARLPGSSANPMLAELTAGKPTLKILNKQDLADPICTNLWLNYYNAQTGVRAIGLDSSTTGPARALIAECRALAPNKVGPGKRLRVLICGIPNVGKSTLINTLAGKRATKTGDEPGITKLEQRIELADDFFLFDTPGMLWPRIIVARSGYNLAASGGIGRNAFDEQEVALELLDYLIAHYPASLQERYQVEISEGSESDEVLAAIGRRRGAVQSGGRINFQKAAEIVLYDFRQAQLGRISLETPEQYAEWLAAGQLVDAERALKKAARLTTKTKISAKK